MNRQFQAKMAKYNKKLISRWDSKCELFLW